MRSIGVEPVSGIGKRHRAAAPDPASPDVGRRNDERSAAEWVPSFFIGHTF